MKALIQYFRVPTGDIPVDYPGREVLLGSRITNISTSGVFIRTAQPLPKGACIEIVFQLPRCPHPICATAIVRWSTQERPYYSSVGPASSGMGLEFVDMAPRSQQAVAEYVKDFLARLQHDEPPASG